MGSSLAKKGDLRQAEYTDNELMIVVVGCS